jgi:pyruvate dehydrogenase E2 component (dihydrolipoamide acetyltransferase)
MEALSPTMEEGQLVRWVKHEGDLVREGEVLAEIETDKATMELVARGSGVLKGVQLAEGQTAPVGTVIAFIAEAGEDVPASAPAGPPAELEPVAPAQAAGGGAGAPAAADTAPPAATADGRVKASPLARRLAADAGVDLASVAGTGPGGRIVRRDIESAARSAPPPGPAPMATPVAEGPDVEEVPVTQMRKTIARRLVTSIGPVPTFYLTIEVDATRLVDARERANERLEREGVKASLNDFIIRAVAAALARHPEVNASWNESVIQRHRRVHLGIAVAVEDGLITPVVRDADRKPVRQIAAEVKELAARARDRKLKPEEYTGATFSISNLGMFGIQEFTAIINPPEAGIIAVGAVEEKVVAENGQVVVRPRMRLTMSCDHRVVDGATGARFLQTVRDLLEEPVLILV